MRSTAKDTSDWRRYWKDIENALEFHMSLLGWSLESVYHGWRRVEHGEGCLRRLIENARRPVLSREPGEDRPSEVVPQFRTGPTVAPSLRDRPQRRPVPRHRSHFLGPPRPPSSTELLSTPKVSRKWVYYNMFG
jgi:hypothetical protein